MGVNLVNTADGKEIINLMSDTVTEDTLLDGVTAHDASGEQITGKFSPYNPNQLDNGDFSVNQRGISGLFSTVGAYFVDMWKLVEGTVTINADGTITLNGTIAQILEHDINEQHLAYASAGTASYDAATRTYTITSLGETIRWAMLVNGKTRMPFAKGNEALELAKCQRYYQRIDVSKRPSTNINSHFGYWNGVISGGSTGIGITIPIEPMRTSPTVSMTGAVDIRTIQGYCADGTDMSNFTVTGVCFLEGAHSINLHIAKSDGTAFTTTGGEAIKNNTLVTLDLNGNGVLEFSAEL